MRSKVLKWLGAAGLAPTGQHLPSKVLGRQHIGCPGGQPQVVPGGRLEPVGVVAARQVEQQF